MSSFLLKVYHQTYWGALPYRHIWSLLLCTKPPATTTRICCVSHGSQVTAEIKQALQTWIRGRKPTESYRQAILPLAGKFFQQWNPFFEQRRQERRKDLCAAIIEVRNTSKTSSELLYFQLESFCLAWAHHFHIYGDFSIKIRIF